MAQPNQKDWTVMWACGALKSSFYSGLTKYQKVNHFPQSFYLTRKDLMYKSISKLREIHGSSHFRFLPQTFLLPNELAYLQHAMEKDKHKLWIAKPAASSQGRGIIVTNKLGEIPQKGGSQYIVSEYISNPMLIDGYKFDLRIYVALTSINPLRIYIYEEGLTRFATCKYDALKHTDGKSKQSKYMHLTNYSLNKHNANYVNNTHLENDGTGSKWSVSALKKKLEGMGIDHGAIWKKIEDIVIKTIVAAEAPMFNHAQQYLPFRSNCFELFGFDILIDSFLEPWLIEVNLSPSLACDSPLDLKVKGSVIADLFTLSGIVPIEQRKVGEEAQVAMRQGCSYGVYMDLKMQSSNKRESHSVSTKARRDVRTMMQTTPYGSSDNGAQTVLKVNPKLEKQVIKETEYEFKRRGKFKRIFPSLDYNYYKQLFQEERHLNYLIDQKVMQKKRMAMAMAINQQQARATTANKTSNKGFFAPPPVIKLKDKKLAKRQNTDLEVVTYC